MEKGIINDRSSLKKAKRVELHLKNKMVTTSPDWVPGLILIRSLLEIVG